MDNLEKVEQLVNKTGCSYEDAKTALENNGWNSIDAIIELERNGKIVRESARYSGSSPVEAEVVHSDEAEKIRPEGFGTQSGSYNSKKAESQNGTGEIKSGIKKLWNRIRSILVNNRMIVIGHNGQKIIDLPIFIPVIALVVFFWSTLGVAIVAMLFGCRFHFEGEDLGKTNINNTMDRATDYAEKVKNDISAKVSPQGEQDGGQNTDH
jgi:hypothetical protein